MVVVAALGGVVGVVTVTAAVVIEAMIVFILTRSNKAPSKFDLYTRLDITVLLLHTDSNSLGLEPSSTSERFV